MRVLDGLQFSACAMSRYPLRTGLILLAMAIGVAAVVVLTSLGEGARRYVVGEFDALGTELLIVIPGRNETTGGPPPVLGETPRDLTVDDALALLRTRTILRVAPVIVGTARISNGSRNREIVVLGSTADFREVRHLKLAQGRFLARLDPRRAASTVVLGQTVREALFDAAGALGSWVRIDDRRFRVIGVLADTGESVGVNLNDVVIMPLGSAQQLFDSPALFRILAQAVSHDDLKAAERAIVSIIRARHEGEDDVTVIAQDAVVATFDRILRALTLGVAGIAAISLVVAGVLIMNVMLVSVAQRTAEIGLLKALGATPQVILRLFLAEAGMLAAVGALLGMGVAVTAVWIMQRAYPDFPLSIPVWVIVAASLVALLTALLFALLPARRASRMDPVRALTGR